MYIWGIFKFAFNAVMPIVLMIALGYFLRAGRFMPEQFFAWVNSFAFRVAMPVNCFYNIYRLSSLTEIDWTVVIYIGVVTLLYFFIGMAASGMVTTDIRQRGVVVQCFFRSNFAVIGMALVQTLGGAAGTGLGALMTGFSVIIYNILAVIALTMYIKEPGKPGPGAGEICRDIVKNPLIIGSVCGLAAVAVRSLLPAGADGQPIFSMQRDLPFLYQSVGSLAQTGSPLVLIALGGQFSFKAVGGMRRQILVGTIWRDICSPVLALAAAILLDRLVDAISFDGVSYAAIIAAFGSPVAVSSVIMASEMHNDAQLASQYVVWTYLLSVLTLFLIIAYAKAAGLIGI